MPGDACPGRRGAAARVHDQNRPSVTLFGHRNPEAVGRRRLCGIPGHSVSVRGTGKCCRSRALACARRGSWAGCGAEHLSALPAAELAVRLAEAYRLIAELTAQAERLSARVEELERQAGKDSSTSSRPVPGAGDCAAPPSGHRHQPDAGGDRVRGPGEGVRELRDGDRRGAAGARAGPRQLRAGDLRAGGEPGLRPPHPGPPGHGATVPAGRHRRRRPGGWQGSAAGPPGWWRPAGSWTGSGSC